MNETPHNHNDDSAPPSPPPRDELDGLLREWHSTNAAKAAAGRDRLMAALTQEDGAPQRDVLARIEPKPETRERQRPSAMIRRIIVNRYVPLAAAAIVLAVLIPFMLTGKSGFVNTTIAQVSNVVMAPEGGRLEAFDKDGQSLGPCALKHTDVKAEISGRFTRVTVVQRYHNPNPDKIEALYTFPLSDQAGVDRMTMTIGDRVIVGEVKERQQARRIYEQAKQSNRVASLLEQERPNIFTQSIANVEPGATIDITISYVEMVAEHDGEFSFAFPTVVSPRYIPGAADYKRELSRLPDPIPAGVHARRGVVLMGPASVRVTDNGPGISRSDKGLDDRLLNGAIASAVPVSAPENAGDDNAYFVIQAAYADGSRESGLYRRDGFGQVGGRWFYCPPPLPRQTPNSPNDQAAPGDNFARATNQVPDADRITPMPTRPDVRAGHDISISVVMDTGGPGITFLDSPQHKVSRTDLARNANDQPRRVSVALDRLTTIPNRDFVLKWKQTADVISSRVFAHTGDTGNFFTVQLDPPAQVKDVRAVPRELVFVVDTSGSMNGKPIAMCKEVMRKAIDDMRPQDTFNIITFAGATRIMWDRPRPNTTANRDEAQRFIETWQGNGGTEMMSAIEAALRQGPAAGMGNALTPAQLADLPADGRQVVVEADDSVFRSEGLTKDAVTDRAELHIREGVGIKCSPFQLPTAYLKRANLTVADDSITLKLLMRGAWTTVNGERVFQVSSAEMSSDSSVRPLRLVMFLTDAEVGNDFAIIEAIKRNRDTTRVFSFGIGSSVNRYLIEQMALAGGGATDFIYANEATEQQANDAVERFNRRTKTPILTDIRVTFNGVQPLDVLPELASVQDLWDNRPLTFMGRYAAAGNGSLTIKGQTAQGPWERTIPIEFPAKQPENSSLPTLWARAKIDALIGTDLLGTQHGQPNPDVRARVITLGETFNVMSQYTSFVAVDKLRVTVDGKPRLVHVPIELPDQTNWEGFFGEMPKTDNEALRERAMSLQLKGEAVEEHLAIKTAVLDQLVASNEIAHKRMEESSKNARDTDDIAKMNFYGVNAAVDAPIADRAATGTPTTPQASDGQSVTSRSENKQDASIRAIAPSAKPAAPPAPTVAGGPRGGTGSPAAEKDKSIISAAERSAPPSAAPAPTAAPQSAAQPSAPRPLSGASGSSGPTVEFRTTEKRGYSGPRSPGQPMSHLDSSLAGQANVNTTAVDRRLAGFQTRLSTANLGDENLGLALRESLERGEHSGAVPGIDLSDALRFYRGGGGQSPFGDSAVGFLYTDSMGDATAGTPQSMVAGNLLTLAAAQLVEAGRIDEAKRLLCPNLARMPSGKLAKGGADATADAQAPAPAPATPPEQLCAAISSVIPDAERMTAVRAARQAAATDLLARRRAAMLVRKLAPDVLIQTPAGKAMGADPVKMKSGVVRKELEAAASAESAAGKDQKKDAPRLMLTILLSDTSEKTLESLKALGIKIVSVKQEASVVVANVPLERVEELALLNVVRRVEMLEEEKNAE